MQNLRSQKKLQILLITPNIFAKIKNLFLSVIKITISYNTIIYGSIINKYN